MSTDHLFVYGTLRRSAAHPMHGLLQPAEFVGHGEFRGRLYDLGAYPGAVASDDPTDIVQGEIYRLADPLATLARLDRYEGCAETTAAAKAEYVRSVTSIRLSAGGCVRAYIYLYQRSCAGLTRITSGDFLEPPRAPLAPSAADRGTPPHRAGSETRSS